MGAVALPRMKGDSFYTRSKAEFEQNFVAILPRETKHVSNAETGDDR